MILRRLKWVALIALFPLFIAGCEPGIHEDEHWKETEGPGLLTGKRGGIILYQR